MKVYKAAAHLLSSNPVTAPLMRQLAYLKNDVFGTKVEDIICQKMISEWREMSILDVGSGPCRKQRNKRFSGVNITCLDIFDPYLKECRSYGFKTIQGDARQIQKLFAQKSFDIVWLIDVIEHMTKEEGNHLLAQLDLIARRQIIVSTPLGWYPQDYECIDEQWLEGKAAPKKNIYQQHKSAWYVKDFKRRGYLCEVLHNYHPDIRSGSKELAGKSEPVTASQIWAVKILP